MMGSLVSGQDASVQLAGDHGWTSITFGVDVNPCARGQAGVYKVINHGQLPDNPVNALQRIFPLYAE